MAVKIAELEIDIRDNGSSAVLALNAVANALSKLAQNTAPATKQLQNTTKELKTVDKTASSAAKGGLSKFYHSIVRIAGYRAIRSALKAITSGFREGVQNIALYSQAIGGLDANKAYETMSAYATMGMQIKNSLGAAVMPLLTSLLPYIQQVADWFMTAADAVARFFATLNGQKTYSVVNKDYMLDYAESINKANKAAKELKRTILGFDEINALQRQSSGGGASGNQLDYSQMFTEANNPWYNYKEQAEGLLWVINQIGMALLAWRVSDKIISLFDKMGALGKVLKVGVGLVLMVESVKLGWDAGKDWAQGNVAAGFAESAGSLIAGAIGGKLLASALGASTGWGFAIGIGVSILAQVVSFFWEKEQIEASRGGYDALVSIIEKHGYKVEDFDNGVLKAQLDVIVSTRTTFEELTGNLAKSLTDLETGRELLKQIFSFKGKSKTAEEIAKINSLCEAFNSLSLGDARVEWNTTTGEITSTYDELKKVVDKYEEYIKAQAYEQIAIEAIKNKTEAEIKRKKVLDEIVTVSNSIDAYMRKTGITDNEQLQTWRAKREELGKQRQELEKQIDLYDTEYAEAIEYTKKGLGEVADATDGVSEALEGVGDTAKTVGNEIKESLKNAFNPNKIIEPANWRSALTKAVEGITINFTASGNNLTPRIMAKASGGLVPTGDLFWAGERAPELIMSAPNGSEVVNMAQFQDAMVSAVMMAGGNGGGDWTIVVQDESGNIRSSQVITAAERANRRDGRTIIPVGVQ